MIGRAQLAELLGKFPQQQIALVGDLFLDRYLELEPGIHELSIETGLEAYQITRVRNSPGALGTVMNNLAALGVGKLVPVTVIGDDGHGFDLLKEVRKLPSVTDFILTDSARLTPTYTKPIRREPDGFVHELNRLDVKDRRPISSDTQQRLAENLRAAFELCDGLIVLDQIVEPEWGVVNRRVRSVLAELHDANPDKLIFVDSRAQLAEFSVGLLKGNRSEIIRAAGARPSSSDTTEEVSDADASAALQTLSHKTNRPAFCTMGERGILVSRPGTQPRLIAGVSVQGEVDIVGAGDAASSGIVTSLLAGANEYEAAAVGNLVASITVQQIGTTGTATPAQVLNRSEVCGYDQ